MIRFIFPLLLFVSTTVTAFAKEPIRIVEGFVKKASDGDTITVTSDSSKLKVSLYGIDAPETEKRIRLLVM